MLDRLPVELVQHVVRLTLPSPCHATYRERQATLLALCRTNRALRMVAQQALFEVVELASRDQFDSLLEAVKAKELGGRVRVMLLDGEDVEDREGVSRTFEARDLALLAPSCSHLVELKTHNVNVDLRWLQDLSTLRRLVVSHGSLCAAQPFCLDTLEVFSLSCIQIADEDSAIFNRPSFPSLRALHIQLAHPFDPEPSFGRLLSQLETFSCDAYDLATTFHLVIHQTAVPVLLDLSPNRVEEETELDMTQTLAQATHVRLYAHAGRGAISSLDMERAPAVATEIARLLFFLAADILPSLSFLIIPQAPRDGAGQGSLAQLACDTLLAECAARGIEVIFEPSPHPHYDSIVSPLFWRRCKALKAKEDEDEKQRGARQQ
ncbi:hypothetical protein JCM10213_007645 [Rhodosporidiobolus nylandii]